MDKICDSKENFVPSPPLQYKFNLNKVKSLCYCKNDKLQVDFNSG